MKAALPASPSARTFPTLVKFATTADMVLGVNEVYVSTSLKVQGHQVADNELVQYNMVYLVSHELCGRLSKNVQTCSCL